MNREELKHIFQQAPAVIGMVHLPALPGSPGFAGDVEAVHSAALSDALVLQQAGVGALMVENFGDAPFFPDQVPAETVAAMASVLRLLRAECSLPLGVNVLRNDALSAMAVAAATGAAFIRVNILSGTRVTDQGVISGRAAELLRLRKNLRADVKIFADVNVKHSAPLVSRSLEDEAAELTGRAGADAVIATGAMTGRAVSLDELRELRAALGETALIAGSGVTPESIAEILTVADAVIVGTAIKKGGKTTAPVDPGRVEKLIQSFTR